MVNRDSHERDIVDIVMAMYDSTDTENSSEFLQFKSGEVIYILNKLTNGWYDGIIINEISESSKEIELEHASVKRGWVPSNFVVSVKYSYVDQKGGEKLRNHSIASSYGSSTSSRSTSSLVQSSLNTGLTTVVRKPSLKTKDHYTRGVNQKLVSSGNCGMASNLFYGHPFDLNNWEQFESLVINKIQLAFYALKETSQNADMIRETFETISTLITHVNLSFNLLCLKSEFKHQVDYCLKKILSILGKILVNSSLFFNQHTEPGVPLDEESVSSVERTIEENLKKLTRYVKKLFSVTKIPSSDYKNSNYEYIKFPQMVPRFFKNSFNGGGWVNPFVSKSMKTSIAESHSDFFRSNPTSDVSSNNNNSINNDFTSLSTASNTNSKRFSWFGSSASSNASQSQKLFLNEKTLGKLLQRSQEVNDKVFSNNGEHIQVLNEPKTRKRDLEINLKAYDEFSSNLSVLRVLENIDLSVFTNLINLTTANARDDSNQSSNEAIDTQNKDDSDKLNDYDDQCTVATGSDSNYTVMFGLDEETVQFLNHTVNSISTLLIEFFDIKQMMHDTVIKIIMCAQQTTLDDPYSFSPMKPNHLIGSREPQLYENSEGDFRANALYHSLISADVENNNEDFFEFTSELRKTCENYAELTTLSCNYVKYLIQEREILLNYAARMMKSDLIAELTKDEPNDVNWYYDQDAEVDYLSDVKLQSDNQDQFSWFLKLDYSDELVFDSQNRIKGGSVMSLLEHLVNHQFVDSKFSVVLLLTINSIFNKKAAEQEFKHVKGFIFALIYRYNLKPPEGLGYDIYDVWVKKKLNPIKKYTVKLLSLFFSNFWSPSYFDASYMTLDDNQILMRFINFTIYEKIEGAKQLSEIYTNLVRNEGKVYENKIQPLCVENEDLRFFMENIQPKAKPIESSKSQFSKPTNSSSPSIFKLNKKLRLLDIDPVVFAEQLTILDESSFAHITAFDCLNRVWKDIAYTGSNDIGNFINNANKLTNFVSYVIVKQTDAKKRARLIEFFVSVTDHCFRINNFSSMTAIISSLYSSPIYRLSKTWELVSRPVKSSLKKLNELMNSNKNFYNYRQKLKTIQGQVPCIPFFGVFLSDLTFISNGNPDFLKNDTNIINFNKRGRAVEIVQEVIRFKKLHYSLKKDVEIYDYILKKTSEIPHIKKQYELSLLIEPKTAFISSTGPSSGPNEPNIKVDNNSETRTLFTKSNGTFLHLRRKK